MMKYKSMLPILGLILLLTACGPTPTAAPVPADPADLPNTASTSPAETLPDPTQAVATLTSPDPAFDGAALLQERCTECHSLDRVTSAHKTAEAWNVTVTRMVKKGTQLDAVEQQLLVEFLAQTYGP